MNGLSTLKKLFLPLIILFMMTEGLNAQRFSTSTIQTQDFPTTRTNFIAKTPDNRFYDDLQDTDFRVIEYVDGVQYDVSATASVACRDADEKPEVNILLVIDASKSMDNIVEGTGNTRFFYVKEAVKTFIDQIDMVGRTHVSTMVFGFNTVINCPWSQNKDELKDSLDNILFQNATRYLPPVNGDTDPANPSAKIWFDSRPDDMPNIVIFLTDGKPSDEDIINEQVSGESFTRGERAIQDMIDENIIFYSMAIFSNIHPFLAELSFKTNGKDFKIDSPEKISEVYELLALEIQNAQTCTLEWTSPYSCDEQDRNRKVDITLKRNSITSSTQFTANANSIADIERDQESLFFGNPNLNAVNSVLKTITYTPNNLALDIRNIQTQPNTYYQVEELRVDGNVVTAPFQVPESSVLQVDIRFTQQNEKIYRQADLIFDADYCIPSTALFGGIDQVILTSPNAGDINNICDVTNITWTGLQESAPIDISYSLDDGDTWNLIQRNATGLSYDWNHGFTEDKEGVRIKLFKASYDSYLWAKGIGGPEVDSLTSMFVTEDETTIFVSGSYEDEIVGHNGLVESNGQKDLVIASYNSGGSLNWMVNGGSPLDDEVSGIVEYRNQVIAVGYTQRGIEFAGQTNNALQPGELYMFLARLDKNGVVSEHHALGNNGQYPGFNLVAEGARIVGNYLEIYARFRGQYKGKLMNNQPQPIDINSGNWLGVTFTCDLDAQNNIRILSAQTGTRNPASYKIKQYTTPISQLTYEISQISSDRTYDGYTVINQGKRDGVLTVYGKTPSSEDISEPFDIVRPVLEFDIASRPIDFTTVPLLDTDSKFMPTAIVNNSQLPVVINNFFFQPATTVFRILSGLEQADLPYTLMPGESIDLEIAFTPTADTTYNTSLIIESDCADQIQLQVTGSGDCILEAKQLVNLNDYNVGSEDINIVEAIFINANGGQIDITPVIDNPEFRIVEISSRSGGGTILYSAPDPLGSISVSPFDTLDMKIAFNPTQLGLRTADLTYETVDACDDLVTELRANGINAELIVDGYDFGIKRINTVNRAQIRVRNLSNGIVNVNNISFADGNQEITFESSNGTSFQIDANSEVSLDVVFAPTSEGSFSDNIQILQGNGETVTALIEGQGSNPTLDVSFTCPDQPEINQDYEIAVLLENTSEIEGTDIESLALDLASDYKLLQGSGGPVVNQLTDLQIEPLGSQTIYVRYTPLSATPPADALKFVADIAIGNGIDDIVPATESLDVALNCGAQDLLEPFDISYNVMACYEFTAQLPMPNPNSTALDINAANILLSGPDAEIVDQTSFSDRSYASNSTNGTYDITLRVPDNGIYNFTLDLSDNNLSAQRIYNVTVNGQYIIIDTENDEYEDSPGEEQNVLLVADIPALDHSIDELDFTMSVNPNVLYIKPTITYPNPEFVFNASSNNISSILDEWSFESIQLPNSSAAGRTPIAEVPIVYLLGSTTEMNFMFEVQRDDCTRQPVNQGARITTIRICNTDSLMTMLPVNNPTEMEAVFPNPVQGEIEVGIKASYDMFTQIILVNSAGEVAAVLFDGVLREGDNTVRLNLDNYSNGIYQLMLASPANRDSQMIMISK